MKKEAYGELRPSYSRTTTPSSAPLPRRRKGQACPGRLPAPSSKHINLPSIPHRQLLVIYIYFQLVWVWGQVLQQFCRQTMQALKQWKTWKTWADVGLWLDADSKFGSSQRIRTVLQITSQKPQVSRYQGMIKVGI